MLATFSYLTCDLCVSFAYASVPCSDAGYTIGCIVTIAGTDAASSSSSVGSSALAGASSSSISSEQCVSSPVVVPNFPNSSSGQWEAESCQALDGGTSLGGVAIIWVPNAPPPPPPPPPPSPYSVAAQAESQLSLPSPTLILNPSTFGLVNFPEWFWVNPGIWAPDSTSATACNVSGCVTATATATPISVEWNSGDNSTTTCNGPGIPYNESLPAETQSTYCSHVYAFSSIGQPSPDGNPNDAAYPISATITWSVTWSAGGAASGSGALPDLFTSGTTSLRVLQAESVIG